MDLSLFIAAFGGGLLACFFGGVGAFVFTGLTVLGAVLGGTVIGAPGVGLISFGSWFGPHISFAGAVAGAAFAMKRNHIENGQDIVTPLVKFGDPMIFIVGGLFGMLGFVIQYVVGPIVGPLVFSGLLGEGAAGWTDTVAFTVVILAIIVRFVFGSTGLVGKTPAGEKREWFPKGQRLAFLLTMGLGIGVLVGGIGSKLGILGLIGGDPAALYMFTMLNVIGFGIAAVSLIFIHCGFAFEGWHHIVLPAGSTATIVFAATLNPVATIVACAITGMVTAVMGDWAGKTFNSFTDTHIDPPAVTILIYQFLNFTILGGIIFG